MVDRVGRLAAVLTLVAVAGKDGSSRQRGAPPKRSPHDVVQSNHKWTTHHQRRSANLGAIVFDDFGLL